MNMQTGQSEDSSVNNGEQVDNNGGLNTEGQANAGSETGHEGENGEQGQQQTKSRSAKARLRRKLQESEQARQKLEEDNRKQAERLSTLEQKVDGVLNPPKPRPDRVDYETEEDYEDALYAWRRDEDARQQKGGAEDTPPNTEQGKPAASEQSSAPAGQPRIPGETFNAWLDSCDDAAEKYDDFDEVLNNKSTPITGVMADTMIELKAAEVAYYLGKNPDEAERISKLGFVQQVEEIKTLTGKFAPSTTNTPDPINPQGGQDDGAGVKDPSKMSPEQYRDWRRQNGMAN